MIGIPYASTVDTKIVLKKEYNNVFSKQKNLLNGSQWYEQQAYRAVNQAIGRCIRHVRDYGAIFFLGNSSYLYRYPLYYYYYY